LVLLFFAVACQTAAPRGNTLPDPFLGEWKGIEENSITYKFYKNGRYIISNPEEDHPHVENEYKILYTDDNSSLYLMTRDTAYDAKKIGPKKIFYDYKKLTLDPHPRYGQTLIIFSGGG